MAKKSKGQEMTINFKGFISKTLAQTVRRYINTELLPTNFSSYNEALLQCHTGYSNDYLADVVYEKTKCWRDKVYSQKPLMADYAISRQLLIISVLSKKKILRVVDFGGGCGAHYFLANHFLNGSIEVKWHVVETHNMVQKGKLLEDGKLRFFEDINEAIAAYNGVDLCFSSSALQYVPNPLQAIDDILKCAAEYIFLTRLPLLEHNIGQIITIQTSNYSGNGPGQLPDGMKDGIVRYPITLLEKDLLESKIRERYEELIIFEEGLTHYFKGAKINSFGYLAKIF
ncbi:MAG: methyltransferase, TIGR04325 family [Deltaproteobacteria bacterium]|nr:methyltransferase, TIGR04325 family [Deltaproteobacteria bacterium]